MKHYAEQADIVGWSTNTLYSRDVFRDGLGSWWHFDECRDTHGPFGTMREAERRLERYCYWLDHDNPQTILVNSSSWTGRRSDVTYHCSFKSKTQLPLFMVYKLWGNPRDPDHGAVLFTTMDWTPSRMCYRYFPRLAQRLAHQEWKHRLPDWLFYPYVDFTLWLNTWKHD